MISTRVMDVKLRESAEGLGEDGTGEFLSPLRWGEAAFAWWEPSFVASCVERRVQSPSVLGYPQPYADSRKTALPFTPLGSIALLLGL